MAQSHFNRYGTAKQGKNYFLILFMMKNDELISIGIDVSKAKLDLAYLYFDGRLQKVKTRVIRNNEEAILRFVKSLQKLAFTGTIICESTGRYHLLLALLCAESKLDIRVINPLLAKKHTTSSIRKNKSDKADSIVLARMILTENNLPHPFKLSQTDIIIRQKMGLIQSLDKQIQSFCDVINSYVETQKKLHQKTSEAEKYFVKMVGILKKKKKALEIELETVIEKKAKKDNNQAVFEILESIPGISAYFARIIYQFLDPTVSSSKQWIGFVGLDISVNQSGTKQGRTKMTKRGNNYLRKRFFSAGWGAAMSSFRPWYDYLRGVEGRSYKETICIIARKIIRLAFTLIKSNQKFNQEIPLFSPKKF